MFLGVKNWGYSKNDVARSDGLPYLEQARAFRPRVDREGIRVVRDCTAVRKIHDALRLAGHLHADLPPSCVPCQNYVLRTPKTKPLPST